jgi:transcriptional regulator with XRE-family HTH domain
MKFIDGITLGQILKEHRLARGVSSRELSRQIDGVNEYYISQLERGQSAKNPNYDAVIQAFRILGLPEEEINNIIPLDEWEKEKQRWLEERVEHVFTMSKKLPREAKLKLIQMLTEDLDTDKIHFRINK